ncbi:MAG: hypothetical protein HY747_07720 [Elusimicrobia bacterium]|nr:hypothetical protein [Elusimicrobiota bacterium]
MEYNEPYYEGYSKKEKVTMTLAANLLKNLDRMVIKFKVRSRSELMEGVLAQWLVIQAKKKLEEETKEYYLSQTPKEKQEDSGWAKIASRAAGKLWE